MSGGSNYDKTWVQDALNRAAIARAWEAMQVMGRALPCRVVEVSGSIVTVAFEVQSSPYTLPQVTIPKAESQWIRAPTQIGDYGIAVPAQTFLGGIDGLGTGTANFDLQGNLNNLYFLPIASTTFAPVNINAAFVSGPQGAVIQTTDGNVVLTLNEAGLTLTIGGVVVMNWSASGLAVEGTIAATDDITASTDGNNISVTNHLHSDVQPGTSDTGTPVANT